MAKTPKAKEFRGVPEAELRSRLEAFRQEIWQHRLKAKSGALQQVHRIGEAKKQIARIQTIIRETGSSKADGAKS